MPGTVSPRRSPARSGLRGAVLLLAVVLAGAALIQFSTPSPRQPGVHQVAAAQPGPGDTADRGRELYLQNCAWCHGQNGSGSQFGPSLVGVGAASADFQLSTGRMPLASEEADPERGPPAFGPEEISALVTYVASLDGGPPIPRVQPGDPAAGRTPYLLNCASCHSASGTGGLLPGGRGAPPLYPATPTQIAEAIRVGPGLMPQFPEDALDPTEVDDIAAYVGTLGAEPNRGGASLDRIGPVAEGLVAWLVAIPVLLIIIRLLGKRAP
jgi:ubiquinol-cytochrome c reductase cytochrome c subunit